MKNLPNEINVGFFLVDIKDIRNKYSDYINANMEEFKV